MKELKPLKGLIAATHAPFHEDGRLDLDRIEPHAAMLAANGVSGVFVSGTTGESLSLSVAERLQVAECWMKAAPAQLPVVVHVGHNGLEACREMAAHAQKIGAYGIGAMAPTFFRPKTAEDLVAFCAEIAAAAPELPFYYYHIPSLTGVDVPVAQFLEAGSARIPTLAGAKFTFENLMDFQQCLGLEGGRFNMLFGRDEILLSALALGATGAVGSTYNYAAPLFRRIIDAFDAGDLACARTEQARAVAMIELLIKYGGLRAGKAMMKMIGYDCGPVRLPVQTLTGEPYEALRGELESIGFFDYCCKAP